MRIGEPVERDSSNMLDSAGAHTLAFTVRLHHSSAVDFPAGSGGPLYALNRNQW
jgi:hypothetical protein